MVAQTKKKEKGEFIGRFFLEVIEGADGLNVKYEGKGKGKNQR